MIEVTASVRGEEVAHEVLLSIRGGRFFASAFLVTETPDGIELEHEGDTLEEALIGLQEGLALVYEAST